MSGVGIFAAAASGCSSRWPPAAVVSSTTRQVPALSAASFAYKRISGAADVTLTVIATMAEWTMVPLVPLTVTLKLPAGVAAGTATVMVAAPAPVIDGTLKATVD